MPIKQTILVVDDEPSIREILAVDLGATYNVLVAKDGVDAVLAFERDAGRIVAIVTDLDMPRLDGQRLTEWVRHISPRLPVVVMSGDISNVDLEILLRGPNVTFLAKPFETAQLKEILRSVLGREHEQAA